MVLLCTSILSTEAVLNSLPTQRLKRNTLFVDVLSVKEFPKKLFLQVVQDLLFRRNSVVTANCDVENYCYMKLGHHGSVHVPQLGQFTR